MKTYKIEMIVRLDDNIEGGVWGSDGNWIRPGIEELLEEGEEIVSFSKVEVPE